MTQVNPAEIVETAEKKEPELANLEIAGIKYERSPALYNAIGVWVRLKIDDWRLPDILDINEFFNATRMGGMVQLLTCSCGNPSCGGGACVKIQCIPEAWILENLYNPLNDEVMVEFAVKIPWEQVEKIKQELTDVLNRIKEEYPGCNIYSGFYGLALNRYLQLN